MNMSEILAFFTDKIAADAVTLAEKDRRIKWLEDDHKYISRQLDDRRNKVEELNERLSNDGRELMRLRSVASKYEEYIPYKEKFESLQREQSQSGRYASAFESLAKIGLDSEGMKALKMARLVDWIAANGNNSNESVPGKVGKIECVRVARDVMNLDLRQAKDLVESLAPFKVSTGGCPIDCGCDGN